MNERFVSSKSKGLRSLWTRKTILVQARSERGDDDGCRSSPVCSSQQLWLLRLDAYRTDVLIIAETGTSRRPFARLVRLPLWGPPLQVHRSRPVTSAPHRIVALARSASNSSGRLRPRSSLAARCSGPGPAFTASLPVYAPLQGRSPSGSSLVRICRRKVCHPGASRPLRSPPASLYSRATLMDHRLEFVAPRGAR
jgi:hypothetical protein